MLNSAILSCFVIVLWIPVYAQKSIEPAGKLKPKNYWGVSIAPILIEKGRIYGDKDKYQLGSSSQLSGEVLVNYYHNFESNYSLVISSGGEVLVHNLHYSIPKEMFIPPVGFNISSKELGPLRMSLLLLKSQAEMQYKFLKKQKKSWFGAVGLSIVYSIFGPDAYELAILLGPSSLNSKVYLEMGEFEAYKSKALLNFHVSVGHGWVIHSGNRLQANLKFNFSSDNFYAEPYRFTVGNQPEVSGKYGLTGSYLGLCLSYIFARSKKG